MVEPSSPPRTMEPHGLQELLVPQLISIVSPPGEAHSLYPLEKALPLLPCNHEKVLVHFDPQLSRSAAEKLRRKIYANG